MKVAVTGATGFVGRHVVDQLLKDDHKVFAIARNIDLARTFPWFQNVQFISCDLHQNFQPVVDVVKDVNVLVHLAWPGLPNYRNFFHIGQNLTADLNFLSSMIDSGIKHLLVTGTCLEYGMQYGPLTEEMETKPITPYGLAKDMLRKSLETLQKESPFVLQWLRLFYMFGDGQNPKSLIAQLDNAILSNQATFNMSIGDQLRDYMPVSEVASTVVKLIKCPEIDGVINCCSGQPTSIIDLVKRRCEEKNSTISLNRGYYPYPDYEPMAFWGVPTKLHQSFVAASQEQVC